MIKIMQNSKQQTVEKLNNLIHSYIKYAEWPVDLYYTPLWFTTGLLDAEFLLAIFDQLTNAKEQNNKKEFIMILYKIQTLAENKLDAK